MKLVSGVMPTRGRSAWAAQALESFLSQTYPAKELVILDDADDLSFPDGVTHELVRYHRVLNERLPIPHKRNKVNGLTHGEFIAHFDSDDWSQPDRLAQQVEALEASGAVLTGYFDILFYNEADGTACMYRDGPPGWVSGTSMLYLKSWWQTHQFRTPAAKSIRVTGSDVEFAREARNARKIHAVSGGDMIVARIHSDNTSPKQPKRYAPTTVPIPEAFFRTCLQATTTT